MPRTRRSDAESSQAIPSTSASQPSSSQMPVQSQTQPSTQAERAAEKLVASMDPAEVNKKVDELVHFLLIMDQKKVPIKKLDINKHVLKDHSKALPEMMKKASERLSNVFGIEVVELQDKFKGCYILVSSVEKSSGIVPWPDSDNARTGLLSVILSVIFMSGNVMQDSELWHSLKGLGIDPEAAHETFGDVKKLVTQELTRQGYLEFTKLPNTDQPVFEVSWGQRAKVETSKLQILKFVSLLYSREPEEWTTQYQDAKDDTENGDT